MDRQIMNITTHNPLLQWWDLWGVPVNEDFIQLDPLMLAGDLYLTEGVMAHAFLKEEFVPSITVERSDELAAILKLSPIAKAIPDSAPRRKMADLADSARSQQRGLIDEAAPILYAYGQMAVGGELRYASSVVETYRTKARPDAWAAWYHICEQAGPQEALEYAISVFRKDFEESSVLGGELWALAAELLLAYTKGELGPTPHSNDKIFVDRMLSLQHNCGVFLNKGDWVNFREGHRGTVKGRYASDMDVWALQFLLDCHASNPPDIQGLVSCASDGVRATVKEYLTLARAAGFTVCEAEAYEEVEGAWTLEQQEPWEATDDAAAPKELMVEAPFVLEFHPDALQDSETGLLVTKHSLPIESYPMGGLSDLTDTTIYPTTPPKHKLLTYSVRLVSTTGDLATEWVTSEFRGDQLSFFPVSSVSGEKIYSLL